MNPKPDVEPCWLQRYVWPEPEGLVNTSWYASTGYSAAFAQLHNAAKPDVDPLPAVQDAPKFLAQQLAAAAAAQPGKLPQLIATTMPAETQAQLQALLQSAGATLA